MRYTKKNIQYYIDIINTRLAEKDNRYTLILYTANGGAGIHALELDGGTGRAELLPCVSTRECYRFVYGMYQMINLELMSDVAWERQKRR